MNDTLPPPAPPEQASPPDQIPTQPEPVVPSGPAAAWLAIAGSSLLLVAAVVVVASRWQQIPQMLRFSGLVTALVMIAALAEQIRRSAPTTATVIAHLVPAIAITTGIAAGATLVQPWPACILIGGLLGAVTTEVQKRRWASPRMAIIAACGLTLAACGIAAQTVVPAAILVAGSAGLMLVFRRQLEAVTMALAVGASPLLSTLTTLKIGDGAMARIGAAGPPVEWSAPIAGLVAATILGIVAHRQRSLVIASAAVASAIVNLVAALAVGRAPASLWACLVPIAVIAVELGAAATGGLWHELSWRLSRHLARPFTFLGVTLPPLVVLRWEFAGSADLSNWAMSLALAGLAAALVAARRLSNDPRLADLGVAAAVGCSTAAAIAVGAPTYAASGVALAALLFCVAIRRPSLVRASLVSAAYLALTLVQRGVGTDRWTPRTAADLALTLSGALLSVSVLLRNRVVREHNVLAVIAATGAVAALVSPDWQLAIATSAVGVVGSYAVGRRPQVAVPVAALTAAAAFVQIGDVRWSAVVAVLVSGVVSLAGASAWLRLAASAQFITAGWLAVRVAGATPNDVVAWMIVAAIVLTGIAFTSPRVTALDAAGIAATALAGLSSSAIGVHPAFASLTVTVGASQGLAYGVAQRRTGLALGSSVVGAIGLLSLWFTTGVNGAVISRLARYNVTSADLLALVVGAAMLLAGVGMRRWQVVSTWLAYGPGLALISAWVASVETSRRADWATMAGLLIGIVAIAVGGSRRMSAPLVIGTGLLTTTVVIASGSQLASLPGWSWLVLGGVVLLALAMMIERRSKNDAHTSGGLRSMFDRFQ